ncbi:XkdX family protein [uncultured Staphylococcus sp.]|nr:XkdX family protein [uncultured Staphylococcus sp.]
MYYLLKRFFDKGLFSVRKIKAAVKLRWITKEQFEEITGEKYED